MIYNKKRFIFKTVGKIARIQGVKDSSEKLKKFIKQTLEPFLPINWEKNHKL